MGEVTRLQPPARGSGAMPQHYVRVTRADHHGFTEFQFSIGDPTLYLDMTLPAAAFTEFCARHAVLHLDAAQSARVDALDSRWYVDGDLEDAAHDD